MLRLPALDALRNLKLTLPATPVMVPAEELIEARSGFCVTLLALLTGTALLAVPELAPLAVRVETE